MERTLISWRSVRPEENRFRFYSLSLGKDLWGDEILVKRWGRIGEQKANLSEKIGTIEERVREEERENWKDTQELKDRIRELEMEKQKLEKRKRFMQFYADRL